MQIIGYSERGAMNALFYWMAFKNDNNAMMEFLKLVGIKEDFSDFEFVIYNEFSLSEFGSPDLVIIANNEKEKVAFFVEAKASCCKYYDITTQKTQHNEYVSDGKYDNGHASNLFFQLRLKNYFFQNVCEGKDSDSIEIRNDVKNRIKKTNGHNRRVGFNPIVDNFVNEVIDCKKVHYIAIVPEQSNGDIPEQDSSYDFPIHFVTWEGLYKKFQDYESFKETIKFNQRIDCRIKSGERIKSQILNTPIIE